MKKKLTFLVLLALLGVFVFLLEGCGSDTDNCIGKKSFAANFGIYQAIGDSSYLVDTVWIGESNTRSQQSIGFKATDEYTTYKWKVGDDPREFDKRSFALNFKRDAIGELKVTLTATGKTYLNCFPQDDGMDVQSRSVHIVPAENHKLAFEGKFEGYHTDEPTKKFIVQIKDFGPYPPGYTGDERYGVRIYNLPDGCDGAVFDLLSRSPSINQYTYRQFYLPYIDTDCRYATSSVYGKVSVDHKTLEINYFYRKNQDINLFSKRKFIGTRVN